MYRLIVFCTLISMAHLSLAQDLSFGFKTGLNFNEIKGEAEESATASETFDRNVGFHFGATVAWNITDLMGIRGELMYSQKGTRRSFEGDSYYNFITTDNEILRTTGRRKQELNVNNSYIELPITFFVKPINKVEIYAGASVGVLVSSTAFGNIAVSNLLDDGGSTTTPNSIEHELDFNYFADNPGERTLSNPASTIQIRNQTVPYPQTAGAYYEFQADRGRLYKGLDLGLVGGLSVYLSRSLYVSGRLNYGLLDVTKSKADVSLSTLENGDFVPREDNDRNISIQASVGFSF